MLRFKNRITKKIVEAGSDVEKNAGTCNPRTFYTSGLKHSLSRYNPPVLVYEYHTKEHVVWRINYKLYKYV